MSGSDFPSLSNSAHSSNSCLGSSTSACARRVASERVCLGSSSLAVSAAVAHAHTSILHDACSNSWSADTGRVKGPTGKRGTKGGVSGPADDLRPVSEVETRGKFPAGRQCTEAGCRFTSRKATKHRYQEGNGEGVGTPSLHPEVPGTQFASPGRGLGIRQSICWTKVCETAQSGIWVLKGIARTRMFPANLDHLRVESMKRGSYKTAWVTPGHDGLCSYKHGHGAAVRPQTVNAIWDGVIRLWGRVAPLLSPLCARGSVPTGVKLNRYAGPRSCTRWHSDNEPLFGPPKV